MSSSAKDTALEAGYLVDRYGGLIPFVRKVGFGGIFYALIIVVIDAITSAGEVLMAPWRALGRGLSRLVEGTIGGSVTMIEASLMTGVRSFEYGLSSMLGPFAFPVAVAAVMLGIYVFMIGIDRIGFSPLAFIRRIRG